MSRWYLRCSEQIRGDESIEAEENIRGRPNGSVVSRIARNLGFESRSGHDFFLPCDIWWPVTQRFLLFRTDFCTLLLVCHVAGHETSSRNDHSADHILWSFGLINSFTVILKIEFYLSRCCGGGWGGMVGVARFITSHEQT